MRIAYICADPGVPLFGRKGASVHVQEMVRAFRGLGHDVTVVTAGLGSDVPDDLADLDVHCLPPVSGAGVSERERAAMALDPEIESYLHRAGPFDLVYQRYSLWSAAGMAYARELSVPGVLEVNAPLIEEQARHRQLHHRDEASRILQAAIRDAALLVAVSAAVADYLRALEGAEPKLLTLPNGVNPQRFRPAERRPDRPFTVGFVGTLKPWHGLDHLVDGFALLRLRAPDSRLLVVGDGPERERLVAKVVARGLQDSVTFSGALAPSEVPDWLRQMDAAVAPYPDLPGFYFSPLKVYEYLAAGVPVVASRIGQLDELLEHGSTCLFTEPGSPASLAGALLRLKEDEDLARLLAQRSRQQVLESHTWEQVARKVLAEAAERAGPGDAEPGGDVPGGSAAGDAGGRPRAEPEDRKRGAGTARPGDLRATLPKLRLLVRRFWPYIRPHRLLLVGAFGAMAAQVLARLLEPWPLKFIFDGVIARGLGGTLPGGGPAPGMDAQTLLLLSGVGVVVIAGVRAAAQYLSTVGFALLGNSVLSRVRLDLFEHLQRLPLSYHRRAMGGDLTLRVVSDVGMLKEVVVTALLPLLGNVAILLSMLGVMFWMNARLGWIAVACFPLLWLVSRRQGRRIRKASRQMRQRESAMASTTAESLGAIELVQSLSLERTFAGAFSQANAKSLRDGVKVKRLSAGLERSVDVLIAVSTAAVLWYGARLVLAAALTPGDLLVFVTYLKSAFKPLREFAKYTARLAKAAAAGERVLEVLDTELTVRDRPGAHQAARIEGDIRFDSVSFSYADDRPVLDGVSLHLPAGSSLAVTGSSGAGKSTIASLVSRLHDPTAGVVEIDGRPLPEYGLRSLRRHISVVLQESVLFGATVRENIALGMPEVDQSRIEAAARLANAHDFILRLPDGYDTRVGERGATLSGGERQRIAVARAALRNARILVLDEPTTGLDEENERLVADSLMRLAEGRTTLLITHDLELAARADRIVYLERGRVAEEGSHLELLAKGGRYATLFSLQTLQRSGREADGTGAVRAAVVS